MQLKYQNMTENEQILPGPTPEERRCLMWLAGMAPELSSVLSEVRMLDICPRSAL